MKIKSLKTILTLLVLLVTAEAISYQHSFKKEGRKESCIPNTSTVCLKENGVGLQVCHSSGRRYSSCKIVHCNDGFSLSLFGVCKKVASLQANQN